MNTLTKGLTMTLSAVVAANIRAEAARRGWTQREMCRRLDMTPVTMSDRFRERTPWTVDELERVAGLFGVEVAELLARPKGFEPLTFWLGVDHSMTLYPWLNEMSLEVLWVGWCDHCGYATNHREPARLAAYMDEHGTVEHDLYVERAA